MNATLTIDNLRQHELVILRRLRTGPLTEFELAAEIAADSGYTAEQASTRIAGWLRDLKNQGFIWAGELHDDAGHTLLAAALTRCGRQLVG
jgi:DNA-binding PadR family transcriptional regulator